MFQLADPAVANELAGQAKILVAALLAAGLQEAASVLDRFDQVLPLGDGQRQRLFAVHVLLGTQRGQRDQRVPMIHGAADDGLNVLAIHHLAKVFVIFRVRPLLLGFGNLFVVDITRRHDPAEPRGILGIATTHAAATDQCDCRLIVGSASSRSGQLLQIPARQQGRGDDGRALFRKRLRVVITISLVSDSNRECLPGETSPHCQRRQSPSPSTSLQ